MTDDAPERIWVQPDVKGYCITGVWPWKPSEQRNVQEYIRADHAQAEKEAAVAAERDAWASYVAQENIFANDVAWCVEDLARDIRADRDARVRAEALREAAAICEPHDYDGLGNILCKAACKTLILDLIPADQEGDG